MANEPVKLPRGLSAEEEAAWAKLALSVEPFEGRKLPKMPAAAAADVKAKPVRVKRAAAPRPIPKTPPLAPKTVRRIGHVSLDATWDRKLKSGAIVPDYTLDLHDHFVDAAYSRLIDGMAQAQAMGARLVLVITGRSRPVEAADRGSKRGVIRAKILDWLAASDHGESIAAVRKAHRKHGGEGAIYIVLRRGR